MYQPGAGAAYAAPRANAAYQYNPQAIEDLDELREDIEAVKRRRAFLVPNSNYRPIPLRWPFLVSQITLLICAIALIVYAHLAMPDSQSTADIKPGKLRLRSDYGGEQFGPSERGEHQNRGFHSKLVWNGMGRRALNVSVESVSSLPPAEETTATVTPTSVKPASEMATTTSSGRTRTPVDDSGLTTATRPSSTTIPSSSTNQQPTRSSVQKTAVRSRTTPPSTSTPLTPSTSSPDTGKIAQSTKVRSSLTTPTTIPSTTPSMTRTTTTTPTTTSTAKSTTGPSTKTANIGDASSTASGQTTGTVYNTLRPTMFHGGPVLTETETTSSATYRLVIFTAEWPLFTTTPTTTRTVISTGMTTYSSTIVVSATSSVEVGGGPGTTRTTVVVSSTTRTITSATRTVTFEQTSGGLGPSGGPSGAPSGSGGAGAESTMYSTSESVGEVSYTTTVVESPSGHYVPTTGAMTVTTQLTAPFTTTETQTTAGHPYIVYGPVTITSSYTLAPGQAGNAGGGAATNGDGGGNTPTQGPPVTEVVTGVVGGGVATIVQTGPPETLVQTVGGGVQTEVVGGGGVQTIVSQVGGTPTAVVVVVTPSAVAQNSGGNGGNDSGDGNNNGDGNNSDGDGSNGSGDGSGNGNNDKVVVPQLSTVGGSPVTVVNAVYQTIVATGADGMPYTEVTPTMVTSVQNVGGTVVTVGMVTVDATGGSGNGGSGSGVTAYAPVSFTEVSMVGGTITTKVVTPAPYQYVTVVDGTSTTLWTTPAPTTITANVGGTPTTLVVVTTPTGTDPLTFTVPDSSTTVGGSLVTIVRSGVPTTLITSLSGHLTTLVSTPPPTTFTSSLPESTFLSTLVSTPPLSTPTGPSGHTGPAAARPTVVLTTEVLDLEPGHYFVATFLPTFVAVMLSLPLRIVDLSAKMYQPFHALTRPGGAPGSASLTLQFTGLVGGLTTPVAAAWTHGEPVPLLTTVLVVLSSLMAPLATEALGLKIHGACSITDERGCAGALGVSVAPAYALVGLLVLMAGLLVALLVLLRRWDTGVRANPWNLAGIAALAACPDLRVRTTSEGRMRRAMAGRRYAFGFYEAADGSGREEYGIVPVDDDDAAVDASWGLHRQRDGNAVGAGNEHYHGRNSDGDDDNDNDNDSDSDSDLYLDGSPRVAPSTGQPFLALTVGYRAAFAASLCALLVLVLYYHISASGGGAADPTKTKFGFFVATNSFGVRFVMVALGVAVTFCWTALFLSVAAVAPFQAMASGGSGSAGVGRPQPPERSILVSRPTNEFSGLWMALRLALGRDNTRRGGAFYLGAAALMTLLAEFLPVLLANVPYNVTETQVASVVCARLVAVILILMVLTLLASFVLVRWPALPADPRTIAGAMYYVTDSHVLPAALAGVSLMGPRDKDRHVRQLGRRYYYGDIVGRSGRRRLAVDADVSLLDPAVDEHGLDDGHGGYFGGGGGRPAAGVSTTAYKGGAFYVYNQQQEEPQPSLPRIPPPRPYRAPAQQDDEPPMI